MPRRGPETTLPAGFSEAARSWFEATFDAPTGAQREAWDAIGAGRHTLVHAPTGSGKTLAAFLWAIDRLMHSELPAERSRCRVLYVSPLKALTADLERNLRAPLSGIALAASRLGGEPAPLRVAVRTGDTTAPERRDLLRHPPDVLVTTPESLYLVLTSAAQEILGSVSLVVLDEIHALVGTKRGAHLALSVERLERVVRLAGGAPPQRVGLSATQRPLQEVARFLGGQARSAGAGSPWVARPVEVVDSGLSRALDLQVLVPVTDMAELGRPLHEGDDPLMVGPAAGDPEARSSIWPHLDPVLLELIEARRSTLLFVSSRRLAERLAARLNELAGKELVRAHHGSLAKERRQEVEDLLKAGRLPALVATSSLELGIDMGAIDLVVQIEAPSSVASGLQRVGRSGHGVGQVSTGRIFPKFRHDLVVAATVARRMRAGLIERTAMVRNPLDVLAQQVVAMAVGEGLHPLGRQAGGELPVGEVAEVVRGAAPFADLPVAAMDAVLDMVSGRFPSAEQVDLRPRVRWDRTAGTLRAREGARLVALTSGGTIPDRGLYGVFTPEGGRVGELDEEMVYEARVGETFVLGASTWRILAITRDRVVVEPAPGQPGKIPFWRGDQPSRDFELGQAVGRFVREAQRWDQERLEVECCLDATAATNLRAYLAEQREASGGVLPTDRQVVLERFRDELGDWRLCVLSPFGARVHAPWAMAIEARARQRTGQELSAVWTDDGIVLRLSEADETPPLELVALDPAEVEELVVSQLGGSALFAGRFRESAARALLLPRRRPGGRTPLWQQRQRAADLLAVASRYGSFPVLVETYRECLSDVFDLPALRSLLDDIASRRVHVASVELDRPSPFAVSLTFAFMARFLYEGDAPLAERRAQALALDRSLLAELVGSGDLRQLVDPGALLSLERQLAGLEGHRLARDAEAAADVLRRQGDLTPAELAERCEPSLGGAGALAGTLLERRLAVLVRVGGEERLVAVEDVARYRDALGVAPPPGLPAALLEPVPDAMEQLLRRFARTHGPFTTEELAERLGAPPGALKAVLAGLQTTGALLSGELRPGGGGAEWCDPEVMRRLRQRSLAAWRREVAPVPREALGRFLTAWQGLDVPGQGIEGCWEAVSGLSGLAIPASILEADVLAARVEGYTGRLLDELLGGGEVLWLGAGSLPGGDGRVVLLPRADAAALAARLRLGPFSGLPKPDGDEHARLREVLGERRACFFAELLAPASSGPDARATLEALWDLVWAGE
ncbi:MAG: DEAD/DEAH box helicase, partial [Acidimicrobiales bacterium]